MGEDRQPQRDRASPPSAGPEAADLLDEPFTAATVTELRHLLAAHVASSGLTGDPADDFVLAVHELVTNAVRHGGGIGRLHLSRCDGVLRCTVTDYGAGQDDVPVDLPDADVPGGRGLWLAHHLTGTLALRRRPDGLAATVSAHLPAAPPDAGTGVGATRRG
ncbi:ATP-binding protein [Micromonospora endolithica]|uniref:ATP-binding protein n=1 Tax=Micromonospora endolithica TaxID=230091 RepID=A0A3A9YY86_9ACTN|nr:ATP-binding protein [Micromonospora endolithica]RKN41102.1 ATP-binding protein [Micromonospora endolithica]TWJ24330.1 anti-sigma regulatory factor (Ser/Thr protein kinase) [Micromonospora endolithica]